MWRRRTFVCLSVCALTALVTAAAPSAARAATAAAVPYFHDFLGGICVREEDLETAYLLGSKGVRPPPLCIEDPCGEVLDREIYELEILGRPATDEEWEDYESMQALVCADDSPSEALTMLLPFDYDLDDPIQASDPLVTTPHAALAYVLPWVTAGPSYIDHRTTSSPASSQGYVNTTAFVLSGVSGANRSSGSPGGSGSPSSTTPAVFSLAPPPENGIAPAAAISPLPVPLPHSVFGSLSALTALGMFRAARQLRRRA